MEIISAVKAHEKGGSTHTADTQNGSSVFGAKPLINKNTSEKETPETTPLPAVKHQEKIEQIAHALDDYVKSVQRDLKIQVHKETGDIIVKVISNQDGKVIREIPSEKILNLAARMDDMVGVLFDRNA